MKQVIEFIAHDLSSQILNFRQDNEVAVLAFAVLCVLAAIVAAAKGKL